MRIPACRFSLRSRRGSTEVANESSPRRCRGVIRETEARPPAGPARHLGDASSRRASCGRAVPPSRYRRRYLLVDSTLRMIYGRYALTRLSRSDEHCRLKQLQRKRPFQPTNCARVKSVQSAPRATIIRFDLVTGRRLSSSRSVSRTFTCKWRANERVRDAHCFSDDRAYMERDFGQICRRKRRKRRKRRHIVLPPDEPVDPFTRIRELGSPFDRSASGCCFTDDLASSRTDASRRVRDYEDTAISIRDTKTDITEA